MSRANKGMPEVFQFGVPQASAFTDSITGTVATTLGSQGIVGSGTNFLTALHIGDTIIISGALYTVTAIQSALAMTVFPAAAATGAGITVGTITLEPVLRLSQQQFQVAGEAMKYTATVRGIGAAPAGATNAEPFGGNPTNLPIALKIQDSDDGITFANVTPTDTVVTRTVNMDGSDSFVFFARKYINVLAYGTVGGTAGEIELKSDRTSDLINMSPAPTTQHV